MKEWERQTFVGVVEEKLGGNLYEWPEVAEALGNNGIKLPLGTSMQAVREICWFILAERKTIDLNAGSDQMNRSNNYNEDFECTPAQYHGNISKLWKALQVDGPQQTDCFTMAANEIERLRGRVDELESHLRLSIEMRTN